MIDFGGYDEWRESFIVGSPLGRKEQLFNSLPVYGASYRLAIEATEMASRLGRNYRYSLGEDIRHGIKKSLLLITLAGKGEDRMRNIHAARLAMLDIQLSFRLLEDLKVLPEKRYVYYLEITEDIVKQLSNWERSLSEHSSTAGVPSPP